MPRLRLLALIAALTAGITGCSYFKGEPAKAETVKPDKQRKPAPDFTLKDADGRSVRLSDYRGKVVLLDFWATWCGPCKIEIPWFMDMERRKKDRGFSVLGVAMDDEGWEVVRPYIAEMGVNYRILMGDDKTAQLYGGIESLPTTFLIDREGRIAAVHVGVSNREEFEDGVEALLRPPVSAGARGSAVPAFFVRAIHAN